MNEQAIFLAALDIADATERAAYVKQTCAGDPALCRQVEALLEAHDRSGAFLDVPALQQVAGGTPKHRQSPLETAAEGSSDGGEIDLSFLQPSTQPNSLGRLGHYEVQAILGRGGCGIVLQAFDEILHRMVAIKVMAPEMAATSPARKRFLREARAAAAIRHENVVSIHAVEEKPLPFLVMEYISGQTLQQKLDENGPLDIQDIVQIGKQIANGLAAAHAIGLIHRDIKPSNILMEKDRDLIKITDFGLARATDDASITQSGVIAGTPLYMSPEQAQGAGIDHRSDLFSLGSVLYVMCSGRPPFRAATTLAVLKRVAEDEPRPIHEIIPEVPEWLTAIIGKLLAKNPADRFDSAQEVSLLLARCLSEMQQRGRVETLMPKSTSAEPEPVQEKPVPLPANRSVPSRSRRWVAAAAVFMMLLAGLGMTEATGVTNLRSTVIRLFSPDGTLVVEVDDPGVSVTIDGEELVITGTGAKEIRLKPGSYKLLASRDGKIVCQELVTVTKNGRQVVKVSKEAVPVVGIGDVAATPDRRAAEWVLRAGGSLTIRANGVETGIAKDGKLPDATLQVVHVNLDETKVRDADLANLQGLVHLKNLRLIHHWGNRNLTDVGLVHFLGSKQLEELHLCGADITDKGLERLAVLKKLQRLNLGNTKVTDVGLAHLAGLTDMEHLNLGTGITNAGLKHLQNLTKLELLGLEGTPVTDEGLQYLKALKRLRILNLNGTQIRGVGLGQLNELTQLNQLFLDYSTVTDAGLEQLKTWTSLKRLNLMETQVTDAGLEHLKGSTGLTLLNLRKTKVSTASVQKLGAALRNCRIEWDGNMNPIIAGPDENPTKLRADWDAWLKEVASLPATKQIQAVEKKLKDRNPGSEGKILVNGGIEGDEVTSLAVGSYRMFDQNVMLSDISPLQALKKLRKVHFLDLPLSDVSPLKDLKLTTFSCCRVRVSDLTPLKNMPLTEVWLQSTPVEDLSSLRGMKLTRLTLIGLPAVVDLSLLNGMPLVHLTCENVKVTDLAPLKGRSLIHLVCHNLQTADLAPLKDMFSLRTLRIGSPKNLDAEFVHLSKLTDLETLWLGTATDAGLIHLKGMIGLRKLTLNDTEVTDTGLANLKGLFRLRELHLAGTRVSDAGLEHLAELKNLSYLPLQGTAVTGKGVAKLKAALPRCVIDWDGNKAPH